MVVDRLIFEVVGYVSLDNIEEKSKIYFTTEEVAIQYIGKYLAGQGYIRPRFSSNKKAYKTLEEYEDEVESENALV